MVKCLEDNLVESTFVKHSFEEKNFLPSYYERIEFIAFLVLSHFHFQTLELKIHIDPLF